MKRKFDPLDIKDAVMDLLSQEKRPLVFELLDIYIKYAETLADYDTLGYLAQKAEYRTLYLKCAEDAYSLATTTEQKFIARTNLYKAYNALNYPEKSLFYIDLNLKLLPDDFETISQKAFNISLAGDKTTAENILLDLVKKHPDKADKLKSAFSGKILREGKTAEGILNFIDTFKPKNTLFEDILKMKKWTGMIMPGKTIYIEGEGGIGDEIINIRFFKYLKDLGMHPVLYSTWSKYREDIVDLFRRNGFDVITDTYSIKRDQLWTNLMSIPGYLNLNESKLWYGTYLTPLRQEKNKLSSKKFKIGIKCSGNPYFGQDEYRSIPIDTMMSYLPEEAEIYYIDKDPTKTHSRFINLANKIDTWEDTLDFIDQMDLIVSSCTSLVHAAGAIGKQTMVAVPIAEYYIWTTKNKDGSSPWYGENFSVYRQNTPRDWHKPLTEIQNKIKILINNEK